MHLCKSNHTHLPCLLKPCIPCPLGCMLQHIMAAFHCLFFFIIISCTACYIISFLCIIFFYFVSHKGGEKEVSGHTVQTILVMLALNLIIQIPQVDGPSSPAELRLGLGSWFIVSLVHLANEIQTQLFREIKVFSLS